MVSRRPYTYAQRFLVPTRPDWHVPLEASTQRQDRPCHGSRPCSRRRSSAVCLCCRRWYCHTIARPTCSSSCTSQWRQSSQQRRTTVGLDPCSRSGRRRRRSSSRRFGEWKRNRIGRWAGSDDYDDWVSERTWWNGRDGYCQRDCADAGASSGTGTGAGSGATEQAREVGLMVILCDVLCR